MNVNVNLCAQTVTGVGPFSGTIDHFDGCHRITVHALEKYHYTLYFHAGTRDSRYAYHE